MLDQVKEFVKQHESKTSATNRLTFVNKLSARDRRFVQELADALHLRATWDEVDDYGQSLIVLSFHEDGAALEGEQTNGEEQDEEQDGDWESDAGEADLAIQKVFAKYDKAKVIENTEDDFEQTYEEKLKEKMEDWKKTYYKVSYLDPLRIKLTSAGEAGDQL